MSVALARKYRPRRLRLRRRADARRDDAEGGDRAGPRGARLPALRPARHGQDDPRARAGDGAQLREEARARRRRALRRVPVLQVHLGGLHVARCGRDRRGVESRRRRRARPPRARDVRALGRRPLQGLHRRRSAHAHARGVECAPEDPRGTAAARRVRLRHHRAAEDRAGGAPVLSRLQRFDLKRIGIAEIRERVGDDPQGREASSSSPMRSPCSPAPPTARCATRSRLPTRCSRSATRSLTAENVRSALGLVAEDELLALLDIVAERKAADVFAASARLADSGADYAILLTGFAEILRAQMAIELGGAPPDIGDRMLAAAQGAEGAPRCRRTGAHAERAGRARTDLPEERPAAAALRVAAGALCAARPHG